MIGEVGLCSTHGARGRLVQWVTRSKYSHVVISIGGGYNVSAVPGGVAIHTDAFWEKIAWSQFGLSNPQQTQALTYLLAPLGQEGKPYAWMDDFLIGITLLMHGHAPGFILRRLSSDGTWQCAELADAVLRVMGINLFPDRPTSAIYPGSFEPIWDAAGWVPA